MRKFVFIIVILFTLCLTSCNGEGKKVKDYITSYEYYQEGYLKGATCGEIHQLTEEDYSKLKSLLEDIYNKPALDGEKNKPSLPAIEGVYTLILENGNDYIEFIYTKDSTKHCLEIFDSAKNVRCLVDDFGIINSFGYNINSYLVKYCYTNSSFAELHPLFKDLNSDDVMMIEVISTPSGVGELGFKNYLYYEQPETIEAYIELYKNASLNKIDQSDILVPGGTSSNMIIYMEDNQRMEFEFYQDCLVLNNNYYSVIKDDVYVKPDRINYSFYKEELWGELYHGSHKIDDCSLNLNKIRFVPSTEEFHFISNYSFKTSYCWIEFMNENYFKYNGEVYYVEEGNSEIAKLINDEKISDVSYIENPNLVSSEVLNKLVYTGFDIGSTKNRVESLNYYETLNGESLGKVLGLDPNLNDEEVRNNYMFLIIYRNGPFHDDFKKVEYYYAAVENGDLHITVQYSCKPNGVYNTAVVTYCDIILIPSSFGTSLKSNFEVTFNNVFQDVDRAVSFTSCGSSAIYFQALNRDKLLLSSIRHLPIYKFDTLEELEQFQTSFDDILDMESSYDEVPSFKETIKDYNEDLFKENTVMLVYVEATSGTYRYDVDKVSYGKNSFHIMIKQTNYPEICTDDMVGWFITVVIPDKLIENCTEIDAYLWDYNK